MNDRWRASLRRLAFPAVIALVALGIGSSLARHGGPMVRATSQLAAAPLAIALGLCLVYRFINAAGWCLILRALGEPAGVLPSVRIWLASEACRWLPGSVWSFGSRAMLSSQRGLPRTTVAASLVLELAVTLAAWMAVAAMGWGHLRMLDHFASRVPPWVGLLAFGAIVLAGAVGLRASRAGRLKTRLDGLLLKMKELRRARLSWRKLAIAFVFYVLMGIFNGAAFLIVVRSAPDGAYPPAWGVIAANAVGWLVGFFAFFAPGGLVVRETCLAALLAPWLPTEQAIVVALAWRLLQVVAEIVCLLGVVAWGLPQSMKPTPADAVGTVAGG